MKVFVVLAVAVLSGCHANLFCADAPKPQLEGLIEIFCDHIAKVTQIADDTLLMIRKSQFGQEVNARLADSADSASRYAVTLQENLPAAAQDLITKTRAGSDMLNQELNTVRSRLETQIHQRVEQLKQELAESLDSEALRTTLMQKSEELKTSLEQSVRDLQAQLGPYCDDLRQKMDQHLRQTFAPYAEDLLEKIDPYTEKLQACFQPIYQSFVNTN